MTLEPRFPVYVISKGRPERCMTAAFMQEDGIDCKVVIEPQEFDAYARTIGKERLLVLPFSNLGQGSIPARNFCWEHSIEQGAESHWLFDDNIRCIRRWEAGRRIHCDSRFALRVVEDFVARYENVALAGFNYQVFGTGRAPVFRLNNHVYSSFLIRNDLPYRWRGRYNEDTDLCLQVLSGDWCTIQINAFLIDKMATMTTKGGNTAELYVGDGRLRMARALERQWPGIVTVDRRFGRPQHVVKANWSRFRTPLIRRPDVEIGDGSEYAMQLDRIRPARPVQRRRLRRTDVIEPSPDALS